MFFLCLFSMQYLKSVLQLNFHKKYIASTLEIIKIKVPIAFEVLPVLPLKIYYFLYVRHLPLAPVEKAKDRAAVHWELLKKISKEHWDWNPLGITVLTETFAVFQTMSGKKSQQKFSCCKCHGRLKYRFDFMCFMVWLQFSPRLISLITTGFSHLPSTRHSGLSPACNYIFSDKVLLLNGILSLCFPTSNNPFWKPYQFSLNYFLFSFHCNKWGNPGNQGWVNIILLSVQIIHTSDSFQKRPIYSLEPWIEK